MGMAVLAGRSSRRDFDAVDGLEPSGSAAGTGELDLTIIIVSWNVRGLLLDCLASIASTCQSIRHETIVVDNASSDDTVAAVRDHFPSVTLIANTTNAGFPGANNQALAIARGRHVLYLNPDTVLLPGTVAACM